MASDTCMFRASTVVVAYRILVTVIKVPVIAITLHVIQEDGACSWTKGTMRQSCASLSEMQDVVPLKLQSYRKGQRTDPSHCHDRWSGSDLTKVCWATHSYFPPFWPVYSYVKEENRAVQINNCWRMMHQFISSVCFVGFEIGVKINNLFAMRIFYHIKNSR